ncbi:MAG: glycosyltransferase family 2 protein [Bryobacterales bacterium]|nr:glycosyltransferase family 2 protein [Bryobacterales bacterium]
MRFTVFTPTYNRAHLLRNVFASLKAQSLQDFEWVVVDDGSTDDTVPLVEQWQKRPPFPIHLIKQKRGGKHRAHNIAVSQAQGELFTVLDSDDTIAGNALERLVFHWHSIPFQSRHLYSGVTCLCRDESTGAIVGTAFPRDVLDCRHYETETVYRVQGEKWGCHRTEVLRATPYPEVPGELFCPEGVVWNRIAKSYLVRHVNDVLRNYVPQRDSLSVCIRPVLMGSPSGARTYYREWLELDIPVEAKAARAVNYIRYSLHAGVSTKCAIEQSSAQGFTTAAAVPGWLYYRADLARYGSHSRIASMRVAA